MGAKFQGRGGALDALRFFAAFGVLLNHWGDNAPIRLAEVHPVFDRGFLATDFFLMLSGFVVTRAYGAALSAGAMTPFEFLAKRLKRLWPAHVIVLLMMAAFIGLMALAGVTPQHPEHFRWADLPPQVMLLHGWPWGAHEVWNYPTWTLSALLLCYVLTPFMLRVIEHTRSGLLTAFVVLVAADLLSWAGLHQGIFDVGVGVVRAVPLYFVGVAIARTCETSPAPSLAVARGVGLAATVILVILQVLGRFDFASVAAIAAIIYAAGARPVEHPRAIIVAGAKLSFALFITHALTATIWFGGIHHFLRLGDVGVGTWWFIWALSFPLALAAAYAFDRCIDQPVQRLIARQVRRTGERRVELGAG